MAMAVPNMRNVMRNLVKNKVCSAASQDIIFNALMVNPQKRISSDDFFMHRWVGGKTTELNMEKGSSDSTTEGKEQGSSSGGKEMDPTVTTTAGDSKGISIEPGSEKLMRRSSSLNDLKSQNLSKELSKPPTPRRLPPLEQQDNGTDGEGGGGGSTGGGSATSTRPPHNLRINTIMAKEYSREGEPTSPAISDATKIMNKGDDILALFQNSSDGSSKVTHNDEGEGGKTPERSTPSPLSPLGRG